MPHDLGVPVPDALQPGRLAGDLGTPGNQPRFDFLGLVNPANVTAFVCAVLRAAFPLGRYCVTASGDLAFADIDSGLNT